MSSATRTGPTPEQLERYADGFNASRTLRFFGVRIVFPTTARVEAHLPIRDEHRGGLGGTPVNGGILAAMFDLVIGCTGALVDPTRRSATVQLSMSLERPVDGDRLVAEAWLDRAGGSVLFASAVIRDAAGVECARCQGIVKLSEKRWESGAHPGIN